MTLSKITENIIHTTSELVSFRTVAEATQQQRDCLEYIAKEFGDIFSVRHYEFFGHPALVLTTSKDNKSDIIIGAHIDVVDGKPHLFSSILKEEKLYGRGVYDMKGPLCAALYAVQEVVQEGIEKTITLIITADEEISGAGMKALLSDEKYFSKCAFIPDGGDESHIIIAQKGFTQIALTIEGESAHASRPWNGVNSITEVSNLVQKILEKYPIPASDDEWKTTVTPTKVESGSALNQIPDSATLYVDIRYIQNGDVETFLSWFKKEYNKGTAKIVAENGMFFTDEMEPSVVQLKDIIQNNIGSTPMLSRECGTSDAIFFTDQGIPAVLYRPNGGGEHSDTEWVDTQSLVRLYQIIKQYLLLPDNTL